MEFRQRPLPEGKTRLYDPTTHRISVISELEVPDGCVNVSLPGLNGEVWLHPAWIPMENPTPAHQATPAFWVRSLRLAALGGSGLTLAACAWIGLSHLFAQSPLAMHQEPGTAALFVTSGMVSLVAYHTLRGKHLG